MRRITSILVLALAVWTARPAQAIFPVAIGGSDDQILTDMVVGEDGSVFVTGHFTGTIQLVDGFVPSSGLDDVFVAKLNADGGVDWLRTGGGDSVDKGFGIALDPAGNVYVTGVFHSEEASFGAAFGSVSVSEHGDGFGDLFVLKLDGRDGEVAWVAKAGGAREQAGQSIAFLPGRATANPPQPDRVVVAMQHNCSTSFFDKEEETSSGRVAPVTSDCSSFVRAEPLLAAISVGGTWRWALKADTHAAAGAIERVVIESSSRKIFSLGSFTSSLTLGSTTLPYRMSRFSPGTFSGAPIPGEKDWRLTRDLGGRSGPFYGLEGVQSEAMFVILDVDVEPDWTFRFDQFFEIGTDALPAAVDNGPGACEAGAWLEYEDGGGTWRRVPIGAFTQGPYNDSFDDGTVVGSNQNDPAWCGNFSWHRVEVDVSRLGLSSSTRFRWVYGTDTNVLQRGYFIDRIRVSRSSGSGAFDEDFSPTFLKPNYFVAQTTDSGSWVSARRLPFGIDYKDLALTPGNDLLFSGIKPSSRDDVVFPLRSGGDVVFTSGSAMVARRDTNLGDDRWDWATLAVSGVGNAAVADSSGDVYLTGLFSQPFQREAGADPLTSEGHLDVFVAKVASDGSWWTGPGAWGANRSAVRAGGSGFDSVVAIAQGPDGELYVGGDFEGVSRFGSAQNGELTALGGRDAYVAQLDTDGNWFELPIIDAIAGVPIDPPAAAELMNAAAVPEFFVAGEPIQALEDFFKWSPPEANADGRGKLFPLRAAGDLIEIRWRLAGRPLQDEERISVLARLLWPAESCEPDAAADAACFQLHVAGAPAEILPDAGAEARSFVEVHSSAEEGGPSVDVASHTLTSETTGFSTIVYTRSTSPDTAQNPLDLEVVKTVATIHTEACTIGDEILDDHHDQDGRTGYVLEKNAYYDGVGPDRAYDRASRTGAIVAVNRPPSDDKVIRVAWYRRNHLGVYWPDKAVQYDCDWPTDPKRIIIASQLGTELPEQPLFDPAVFPSLGFYDQPDPSLPGFNPNDEHALIKPSNAGSGLKAIFALRSDFGSAVGEAAASEPYVLAKYRDPASAKWRFEVYKVEATGEGFDSFSFEGTAATAVQPPFPVRLLAPCAETEVMGEDEDLPQPPAPFYRDTNDQLWSRSAGTGTVLYHYPLQPGWFIDLDNDGVTDQGGGTCIPWLARLPAAQGGTADPTAPIEAHYDISWPEEPPVLLVGETLLTPKRGLPDIFNQAAVKVAFDELQEQHPLDPTKNLVQLIDPLGPRSEALEALPDDLATELDERGKTVITGNAGGDKRLPFALHSRLRYDPIAKKLTFQGLFDDSGAGDDPLLLLNVMTFAERDQLKALSSDPAFDGAIDALFRKSRNPNGIKKLAEGTGSTTRPVRNGDILIGFEDRDNNGILEPFGAEGLSAALTAGAAQDTGYVTLVFNDSESLALPVSLQVIRVDCLVDPGPPELISPLIGQIHVIESTNVFDEQLTLRHSGDFGGRVEEIEFEWFVHPDVDGTPPKPVPDPANNQLHGWQLLAVDNPGGNQVTLGGANIQTLSDNWYLVRYRGLPVCNNDTELTVFAGQPGSPPRDPRAQLGLGWVKRVVAGLNPFDARVKDFHRSPTNTFASMIAQLGTRFEGPIAFSDDPDNLNQIGLIEAYETVLRRALQLSVDSTPPVDYEPANAAILNIASRISDFYMLLGNEAFADAQDPTIGITTDSVEFGFGALAPTIFNFQNQVASLIEEELVLLRGRDDAQGPVAAAPVYNRFFWNFTQGQGEVAYALSYNVSDQNVDGFINEFDARILFPQGHGDAWGHYLTAQKVYYGLLRHPFYSWNPRPEAVPVAGAPIQVDFLDERKFARAAAARARAGADIVDLTYRSSYVEDPAGQWQGYKDTDPERAWGLDEWGRRAGMGAYFDWVVGNAILPDEDPDPAHVGIQKVDRETVDQLEEIIVAYDEVQSQVDEADRGLNPLGLAKGVVPFDIDPSRVDAGETHFEQIFDRATEALANAVEVWDFANQLGRMLRRNQDSVDDLDGNTTDRERDFKSRLIEIFGKPYEDDVGAGGTYPNGYDGPDIYHFNYTDAPALAGTPFDVDLSGQPEEPEQFGRISTFEGVFAETANGFRFFDCGESDGSCTHEAFESHELASCESDAQGPSCVLGSPEAETLTVEYFTWELPGLSTVAQIKPPSWRGQRPATGKIQEAISEILNAQISLHQALREYDNLRLDVECALGDFESITGIRQEQMRIINTEREDLRDMTIAIQAMQAASFVARRASEALDTTFKTTTDCIPDDTIVIAGLAAGVGGDLFAPAKCASIATGNIITFGLDSVGDGLDTASNELDRAKEDVSLQAAIEIEALEQDLERNELIGGIVAMMRQEPLLRNELFARAQIVEQAIQQYRNAVTEGQRIFGELIAFRKDTAAAVQDFRHQDMAFRVFRNDALQKYRAAFDMAARYTYLSAAAYDYDTNLLGSDGLSGRDVLTDIVRKRSLGQLLNGEPVAGSRGLADPLGRMRLNFDVLKGQMGFNNPQVEANRFSLRRERFRIGDDAVSDPSWRETLQQHWVDNLWDVPEFRRFVRPFAPESAGVQPGLVIPFTTTVTFGLNFFGWPLGPGDSAYDPSQFSTRIRGAGIWFEGYGTLPLSNTPRIYLVPAGADVLRPPTAGEFTTREWAVVDQLIPVPFPIGPDDLSDPRWSPLTDMLSGSFDEIRRFGSFRAHASEPGDLDFADEISSDSRLIGRSVWNTRWLLIIPGGTLLFDPADGLETFIHGPADGAGMRDGRGVSDILLTFQTYAYQGF